MLLRYALSVALWLVVLDGRTAHAETLREKEVLAKTLLAEAGEVPCVDHAAILHVLKRRQTLPRLEDRSVAEVAQAYSTFWHDPPPTARARMIRELTWDEIPAWTRDLVDTFEAGELADPCEGRAWHWGSVEDASRRPDLEPVGCGSTVNVFFGAVERPRRLLEHVEPAEVVPVDGMELVVIEPQLHQVAVPESQGAPVSWMFVLALIALCGVLLHRLGEVMAENERRRQNEDRMAREFERTHGRRDLP